MQDTLTVKHAKQLRAALKNWRLSRGLSQAALGELLGLSQVRIANIEAQTERVSFEQLFEVFKALGVDFSLRETQPTVTNAQGRASGSSRLKAEGRAIRATDPDAETNDGSKDPAAW